jgi:hypothetical protein
MPKSLLIAATFIVAAATAGAQDTTKKTTQDGIQAPRTATAQAGEETREAAEDFARRFFAACDADEVAAAKALLAPEMKIVAFDARERNVAALLHDVAAASASRPAKRELGNFEVIDAGALIVVAFDNRVTPQGAGETSGTVRMRESWVLKPTPAGLRAVWAVEAIEGAEPDPHFQPGADAPAETKLSAQDQAAADFIAHFFDAYIGRRPEEMRSLFLPGSRFVFPTAEESSADAMAEHQTGPEPPQKYPRPKNGGHFLDHFEVLHVGPAMVVAFDNHVTDWRSGHPEREEHVFRESWVIKDTPAGLRDVWVAIALYGNSPPPRAAKAKSR